MSSRNKLIPLGISALLVSLLTFPLVTAFTTPNDVVGHTHLSALAPVNVVCGRYVRGAENGGQNTNPAGYDYIITGLTATVQSNAIDHHWFHDMDAAGVDFVVFDMGSPVSQVILYPAIDHGPVPAEAIEGSVYATNNLADPENTWVIGDISVIYDPGWDAGWIADDWVQVWDLPSSYRYIGVNWGGLKAMIADGDVEFDALCAPIQVGVPEFDASAAIMSAIAAVIIPIRILAGRKGRAYQTSPTI